MKPGNPYQLLFILVGDGANGKSTLLEALRALLGPENTAAIALQEIASNRFAAAELAGKLANIYPDLPRSVLKETGIIKTLSGGDQIKAERKFRDPFMFTNQAKLIFSANVLPEVDDRTYAFWRRWVIIRCPNKFEGEKADRTLLQKLKKPEELSGALNLALKGLKDLEANGFCITKSAQELREEWRRRSNSIYAFVCEELEPCSENWISKDELYAHYVEFCNVEGFTPKAKNAFFTDLTKAFIELHNCSVLEEQKRFGDRRVRVLKGLKFKEENVTSVTDGAEQTILISQQEQKNEVINLETSVTLVPPVTEKSAGLGNVTAAVENQPLAKIDDGRFVNKDVLGSPAEAELDMKASELKSWLEEVGGYLGIMIAQRKFFPDLGLEEGKRLVLELAKRAGLWVEYALDGDKKIPLEVRLPGFYHKYEKRRMRNGLLLLRTGQLKLLSSEKVNGHG